VPNHAAHCTTIIATFCATDRESVRAAEFTAEFSAVRRAYVATVTTAHCAAIDAAFIATLRTSYRATVDSTIDAANRAAHRAADM
jgi:hypothetical protein